MSWIGRKIYEYLKECEEYKQTWSPKSDNLSEPPRSEEFNKDMNAGYQPKDKLDTSNPPNIELPFFKHTPPPPERVPFENFKNNRKKMKKEVRHKERYTLTLIKEDGKVSITIEPKKGFDVCNVRLSVGSVKTPKEPVLPKELLNPKPELQAQYDTLAKLIATRDYYNAGHVFNHRDIVYCICSGDVISVNRYECEITPLFFKDGETAQLFQKNFRNQIEQVKHLI